MAENGDAETKNKSPEIPLLGRIRRSVLARAFPWFMGGNIAVPVAAAPSPVKPLPADATGNANAQKIELVTTASTSPAEQIQADTIIPYDVNSPIVLNSNLRIENYYRNVRVDKDGVQHIPYAFQFSDRIKQSFPDSTNNRGEVDFRLLTEDEKNVFRGMFSQHWQDFKQDFYEVSSPDSAYLSISAADLSNYRNEYGSVGAGGYALYPQSTGGVIVIDANSYSSNPNFFTQTSQHEFGHSLGLRHSHRSPSDDAENVPALPKAYDNVNSTQMSYKNSDMNSAGGKIVTRDEKGSISTTFQPYDYSVLTQKYPVQEKEGSTITPNGSGNRTYLIGRNSQLVIPTNAGSSFINMQNAGEDAKHVSVTGDAHYWFVGDLKNVTLASGNNAVIGNQEDNVIRDDAGSSVFMMSDGGRDTIYTGGGNDIIQVAGLQNVTLPDYDATHDRIEFDEKEFRSYTVKPNKPGSGSVIRFKSKSGKHFDATLHLPNTPSHSIGPISAASEKMLTEYRNSFIALEAGKHSYSNFQGQVPGFRRILSLPDSVAVDSIVVSSTDDGVSWNFHTTNPTQSFSFSARGAQNVTDYHYVYADETGVLKSYLKAPITYGNTIHQPDGTTLQMDDQRRPIVDARKNKNFRRFLQEQSSTILAQPESEENYYSLHDSSYLHRTTNSAITFSYYRKSAVNFFDCSQDAINGPFDNYRIIDCGAGRMVICANYSLSAESPDLLYINKMVGDSSQIDFQNTLDISCTFQKLDELPESEQNLIRDGLEWSQQCEAGVNTILEKENMPQHWQNKIKQEELPASGKRNR